MTRVSAKTPQAPDPTIIARLFGESEAICRYVDLLLSVGVDRGVIGPGEAPRIWERHILNCAVLAPVIPAESSVADIGSGAGLPGLVLAIARPDLSVTLIEPLLRRTGFLQEAVTACGLGNVEVVRDRAENLSGRTGFQFDVVTARAVAPLVTLARWALPLCRPGGELLALKGKTAENEVRDAGPELRRMGVVDIGIDRLGSDVVTPPATVVRIQSTAS